MIGNWALLLMKKIRVMLRDGERVLKENYQVQAQPISHRSGYQQPWIPFDSIAPVLLASSARLPTPVGYQRLSLCVYLRRSSLATERS